MKKIVSVLALAALTLGLVFADMSLGYTGYTNVFNDDITARKEATAKQNAGWFKQIDENGVGDKPNSNLVFSLSNDVAGAVFDTAITVTGDKTMAVKTDQYYGWLTFGKAVFTVGKWKSRYVNRINADAGAWSDMFYETYKPGFVNYYKNVTFGTTKGSDLNTLGAIDSDNLTKTVGFDGKVADEQALAGALAFTTDNIMLKFVAIDGDWGYLDGYEEEDDVKTKLQSGLAFEFAFRTDAFAVNAFVKTLKKDSVVFGAFLNPIFGNGSSLMFGATVGIYTGDFDKAGTRNKNVMTGCKKGQMLLGIDLRARFAISDAFTFTTMNNFSLFSADKTSLGGMWNMFSGLYKFNDTVALQVTLSDEIAFGGKWEDNDVEFKDGAGISLRLTPAVVLTAGPGATLTAGISYSVTGLGKKVMCNNAEFADANKGDEVTSITQNVCVPLIFKVDL